MASVDRDRIAHRALLWPCVGSVGAIAATSVMDATGLSTFSALALAPLLAVLCRLQRFSRADVGFRLGHPRDYGVAVLYPIIVSATLYLVAALAGDTDLTHANWRKALLNLALVTGSTVLVAVITEEGFFRGWLWESLERVGLPTGAVIVWSSVTFSAWHWSSVFLPTSFAPPKAEAPVLMLSAVVLGVAFGLLRWASGSIVVSSVSHGVWNGLAYVLFGFGTRVGALGIKHTGIFGPEVGLLGLALNIGLATMLWIWYRPGRPPRPISAAPRLEQP